MHTPHGHVELLLLDPGVDLLPQLHADERALTTSWGVPRQRTFAGGRAVLRRALAHVGVDTGPPILRDDRGAPVLPAGVRASVSHKDDVAVALVCLHEPGHVGVDVEPLTVRDRGIARHVLTPRERADLDALPDAARDAALITAFSLKEALYKALDPTVRRFVGFLEVEVDARPDGTAAFTLALKDGEGPFQVDGAWRWTGVHVVTTARVRPG